MVGVLVLHSQGVAQMIVEEHLVPGEHRVAAGYSRFIQKFRAVTVDQGKPVPQVVLTAAVRVGHARDLAIEVVTEVRRHFSRLRNRHQLIQPCISITLISLFYKPSGGVIGIFRHFSFGFGAYQLVRPVVLKGGGHAIHGLREDVPGRVVDVAFPPLDLQQLPAAVILVRLPHAVDLTGDDHPIRIVEVFQLGDRRSSREPHQRLARQTAVFVVSVLDRNAVHRLLRQPVRRIVLVSHLSAAAVADPLQPPVAVVFAGLGQLQRAIHRLT